MTQRTVAPETIETPRLLLRRPRPGDAEAIFTRDSADPEVTRYVGWPAHKSVEDTRGFLAFSDGHWQQWPAGAYLAWSCQDGRLPGSTGLLFETPLRAMTGYVFARDAWGRGYATEALAAMVATSPAPPACCACLRYATRRIARPFLRNCGCSRRAGSPSKARFAGT